MLTLLARFAGTAGVWKTMAVAALLLAACSEAPAPADDEKVEMPAANDAAADSDDSTWPRMESETDPEVERFVDDLLSSMSLERKVGQIIQAEIQHVTPEDVREYGLGSVLNGGGSFPGGNDQASVSDWSALSTRLHEAAVEAGDGEPAIPLIWGTDAVHGHNNVFGATVFPHNVGLGAARDPELVRAIGEATAEQVAATGIDWNFAPTLAVARDLRWGRAYESFSSDPQLVTELGRAAILGLQGEPGEGFLESPHVVATAKHFVGDGGTTDGVDQGDARMPEAILADVHGKPYPAALEAGVQTVMASFSSWNGEKLHGHRYLLTDVLKGRLGFDGFVIGDWNGHGQVPGCSVTDCLEAFEAGVDMFMVPEDWLEFRNTLLEHARNGRLPMARLDDAVRRILRVKKRAGLFDDPVPAASDRLPSPEVNAGLARRAVRQSLVLLKNDDGVLPLDPASRILVVGDGADDIGKQSGGWTLDWQGRTGANDAFPNGQSIFAGLAEQVRAAGGEVRLGDDDGDFEPDAIIAVYGEDPYAEGQGDMDTLEFQAGTREAVDLLDRLADRDVPVVSVFISGRPMWTNPEMNRSDAFVAAWLPGTEGGGIADVVLRGADGAVQHDFSGRLSFDWPAQPLPNGRGEFEPLFEYGHGLTYAAAPSDSSELPEDAMAPRLDDVIPDEGDWTLFDGSAHAPWRLVFQGHNNGADPAVEPTDRRIQGDARRVTWTDGVPGTVSVRARPPVDLSGFIDDSAVLAFDLRLESPVPEDLEARMLCGDGCASASLNLADPLADRSLDAWRALRIDLACFASNDSGLSRVERFVLMATSRAARMSVADIRIERQASDRADVDCTP